MTTLITTENFAATVNTLADAIIDASKSRGKVAAQFREVAAPAYGSLALQGQAADLLTAIRREADAKRDSYVAYLSRRGDLLGADTFKKSVINAMAYAAKVAGEAAGCRFEWDKSKKLFRVGDLPAANEKSTPSAAGKDANSAEQSAAIVAAAEAAPIMTKAQRQAAVKGALLGLLEQFTLAELEGGLHAIALDMVAKDAEKDAAEKAAEPKAPAILAEKLIADGTAPNGAKIRGKRRSA